MKVLYAAALFIMLSSSTCEKERLTELPSYSFPKSPQSIASNLVWRTFLAENHGTAFNNNPIVNREQNVLTSSRFNPNGREIFKLYDGKTGALKWTWDDYLRNEEGFYNEAHLVFNDIMVLSAHNATYAFNMVTGQTLWKNYIDTMYGEAYIFKDDKGYVYKLFDGEKGQYTIHVFRTRYDQLNWELVCSLKDSTETYPTFSSSTLTATQNRNEEDVIVFTTYKYKDTDVPTKSEVVCYNLTRHKFDWIKDYSDRYGEFAVARIQSAQGRVFTFATRGSTYFLCCFDVNTGELLWENKLPDFGVSLHLYKTGLIVTCNNSSPVRCYHQNTGYIKWEQRFDETILPQLNFQSGASSLVKQYLFSTLCDHLLILNADYGAVVYLGEDGNPEGCLQDGVAVNERDQTLYVGDRSCINCFKLPAEVKW